MPIYEYACPACGRFELRRPFDQAGAPATCPTCGAGASRRYGPPNLVSTPAALARAKDRSERSAHEPEVATAQEWTAKMRRARLARPRHGHRRPWSL